MEYLTLGGKDLLDMVVSHKNYSLHQSELITEYLPMFLQTVTLCSFTLPSEYLIFSQNAAQAKVEQNLKSLVQASQ